MDYPPGTQAGRSRLSNQGVEARDLCGCDAAAEAGEAVVAPALVGARAIGTLRQLFDQALLEHPADGTVERAGAQPDLAVGPGGDVLHDGVAVTIAIRERDQDVEDARRERQQRVNRFGGFGVS